MPVSYPPLDVYKRQALTAAEDRARGAGVPLRISYTDGNRDAPAFCARQGYVEVGREDQAGMPEVIWMAEVSS